MAHARNYWTKERCQAEANKFKTKKDFCKNSSSAFTKAAKCNWLHEICQHMNILRIPKSHWTKERCKEKASKYKTRTEFRKNALNAYKVAATNKWLDEICQHMDKQFTWSFDKCLEVALQYNTRKEFSRGNPYAYTYALKHKIIDTICHHMKIVGNRCKRCIYVYEFENNHVYVGLTSNLQRRHTDRLQRKGYDGVKNYIEKNPNIKYCLIQLTEYVDINIAVTLEGEYLKKYVDNGWISINKSKTGSVGGIGATKWTKRKCEEEAKKYNSRSEFSFKNESAYKACRLNGWLDELCNHMKSDKKPIRYWNENTCNEVAKKFDSINEFMLNEPTAYRYVQENDLISKLCSHMLTHKPNCRWTLEMCIEESKKYKTKQEFKTGSNGAYGYMRRKGLLDELFK